MKNSIEYKNDLFNEYRKAQEFEKKRIANELHDTSLQTLAHVVNKLEVVSIYMDKDIDIAKQELVNSSNILKSVIDEIRDTIYNLRPMSFDDLSFKSAIEQHILKVDKKSNINYHYNIDDIYIDDEINKLSIFRCIQECINNCEKHSNAKNCYIDLLVNDKIEIFIKDDGDGFIIDEIFNPSDNHFGLRIIRDRVEMLDGELFLKSEPGNGFMIKIVLSLFS